MFAGFFSLWRNTTMTTFKNDYNKKGVRLP